MHDRLGTLLSNIVDTIPDVASAKELYRNGETARAGEKLFAYFQGRTNVHWFFSHRDKPRLISDFKRQFPKESLSSIARADSMLEGKWHWYGKYWDCGFPPRWFEKKDDVEYLWQLNRHDFLQDLGVAYWLTGDEKYSRGYVSLMANWIDTVQPPALEEFREVAGHLIPWRLLEVGIRPQYWISALEFFHDSPHFTGEVFVCMLYSLVQHMHVLNRVSPIVFPDVNTCQNHHLYEMQGLFYLTQMFPEIAESARAQTYAMAEIKAMSKAHVWNDGTHFEETPDYHDGAIGSFALPLLLGKLNGISFGQDYESLIKRLLYFESQITRPDLTIPPFNDTEADLSPLEMFAVGEHIFGQPVTQQKGAVRGGLMYWFTNGGSLKPRVTEPHFPVMAEFPDGGYYCLRSSWERDALFLVFRNGKNEIKIGGHKHADSLSFDLSAYGRPLIIEPGPYTYTDNEWRKYFKSTAARNSITIDDKSTREYIDAWTWGPIPNAGSSGFRKDENGVTISSWHEGFSPVRCNRQITFIGDRFWLVRDSISGLSGNRVTISYHFTTMEAGLLKGAFDGAATAVSKDRPSIAVIQIGGSCKARLDTGWHALTYLEKREHRVLRLVDDKATGTCNSECVMIPFPADEEQDYSIEVTGREAVVTIRGSHPLQRRIGL